jgi:hypothetical protein
LKILKGLEAAVEVVKGILKQYDSDSYRYMLQPKRQTDPGNTYKKFLPL